MNKEYLDLLDYLPKTILVRSGKQYPLEISYDEEHIDASYMIDVVAPAGKGEREYSCVLPRYIPKTEATFEVLGLLQAEMGKTENGNLSFSNYEYKIINSVLRWFEEIGLLQQDIWRWSIKVNINEPTDEQYKQEVEKKVIEHWLKRTKINYEKRYPKTVTYVNENYTKNKILKQCDYGTLVLEYKNKLFSDVIKHFVKKITYEKILTFDKTLIRGFMRGIIAGEGCINYHPKSRHYAVHISATKQEEREIYKACLAKLNISLKTYNNYSETLLSETHNIRELLNQRLVTISPDKYAKFLYMTRKMAAIRDTTAYFQPKGKNIWNKIPQEKIDKIIQLYNSGITRTMTIAEQLDISAIKVNRVLRVNNLGKRALPKISQLLKQTIADFAHQNLTITNKKLAEHFHVSQSVINRICVKYQIKKENKSRRSIPEEKIKKIIQIYKENPAAKVSDISATVGVSSTVIRRVRKENSLEHLGYLHLIGNNNKHKKLVS